MSMQMIYIDQRNLQVTRANPLANEDPTSNAPIKPGPRVYAMAVSCLFYPASLSAVSTTGIIFC